MPAATSLVASRAEIGTPGNAGVASLRSVWTISAGVVAAAAVADAPVKTAAVGNAERLE